MMHRVNYSFALTFTKRGKHFKDKILLEKHLKNTLNMRALINGILSYKTYTFGARVVIHFCLDNNPILSSKLEVNRLLEKSNDFGMSIPI